MVSTFTPNVQLEEPARGDDVGTWDTPVNGNTTNLDLMLGGIATIGLNNSNIVLSAAQYRSKQITFNSTLTGNVTITFPTSFTKSYEIQDLCSGSSDGFIIVLQTTAAGGQVICLPPGEIIDVVNDGANLKFKNFGRIGSYMNYIGVPGDASGLAPWMENCTVKPYLNCDGTSFSSATYPALAGILGGTTLPDIRGTVFASLNQGTGRLTNVVNGNVNLSQGGADTVTLTTSQIPAHNHGVNDPTHIHAESANLLVNGAGGGETYGSGGFPTGPAATNTAAAATGISIQNAGGGGSHGNVMPTTIGGVTLIRAG